MKKTISINLSGYLFHIDEDGYAILNEYLDKIAAYYSNDSEGKDIIQDIESRIAELLNERLQSNKKVVALNDINEIIKTMGEPFEFEGNAKENYSEKKSYKSYSSAKRLYRDPDNRILGGVCGGLGAYFNVDPIIFRIIFIVMVLGAGMGVLIYIVLWIVIPEAITVAQKIEMRGEPVNASTIGDFFKKEFNEVKKNFKGRKKKR